MNYESVETARKAYAKRIIRQWVVFGTVMLLLNVCLFITGQIESVFMLFVYAFSVVVIYVVVIMAMTFPLMMLVNY